MSIEETIKSRLNKEYIQSFVGECLQFSPRISTMILGHGRAGKDTLADLLVKDYGYVYNGTSSIILCKKLYPENPNELYLVRHTYKTILFDFGNLIRDIEPRYIPYMTLQNNSNLLVGLRSIVDIKAILSLTSKVIWVHRDVGNDPTMDFGFDDIFDVAKNKLFVVNNTGSIKYLREQLDLLLANTLFD